MIPRYTRPEMGTIWQPRNRYQKWLDIEIAVCEAWAERGLIPQDSLTRIKSKADFNPERIDEIEKITRHDVIAFTTNVAEYVGEDSRFIHRGLTSYDVVDTAFSLLLKEAGLLIRKGLVDLLEALKARAEEHRHTPMVGRSHGIHAEPITFGLKLALFYSEMERHLHRWDRAVESISVGKISGAVGTFAHLDPQMETEILSRLGLKPAAVSNQVIQRDRHGEYFAALALMASSMEKIAVEIRHLQRTEVAEVEEFFHKGQKGSSAMPHKRNPVLTENLSGLARIIRGNALAAMENVPLWHERDISHSSVERVIAPDSTILADFMIHRLTSVVRNMVVYKERMLENLNLGRGLIFSEAILIRLVDKGLTREAAYAMVQRNAMRAWEEKTPFMEELLKDTELLEYLTPSEIESAFDVDHALRWVDAIFGRVFSK
ncbi:adenylosuccinate lyase [Desulfomonile tiedjei]|uniref:Adenylosuccinate lyase n=1 Tax=Desulfomonile tiedjei (strain ATCC 49306 / DSM 6799 / DCB-1) TaxID=706587 RepID=I4C3M0_DESTA|nr:adenylosuccinate lyase [Desulfomonile tiedjei]AFM24161.1 adenylosuccinate lyase [Desulfomonile tiedjei DSM 6799]